MRHTILPNYKHMTPLKTYKVGGNLVIKYAAVAAIDDILSELYTPRAKRHRSYGRL